MSGRVVPVQVTIPIHPRAYKAIGVRATEAGVKVSEYVRRLFDAAWMARVADERGEESYDAALDRQVKGVFLLADCEPEFIAEALRIPLGRVDAIVNGWRQAAAAGMLDGEARKPVGGKPDAGAQPTKRGGAAPWPEDTIETVRAMWADGKTAREIAAAIGKTEGNLSVWASNHRDVCPKRISAREAAA